METALNRNLFFSCYEKYYTAPQHVSGYFVKRSPVKKKMNRKNMLTENINKRLLFREKIPIMESLKNNIKDQLHWRF